MAGKDDWVQSARESAAQKFQVRQDAKAKRHTEAELSELQKLQAAGEKARQWRDELDQINGILKRYYDEITPLLDALKTNGYQVEHEFVNREISRIDPVTASDVTYYSTEELEEIREQLNSEKPPERRHSGNLGVEPVAKTKRVNKVKLVYGLHYYENTSDNYPESYPIWETPGLVIRIKHPKLQDSSELCYIVCSQYDTLYTITDMEHYPGANNAGPMGSRGKPHVYIRISESITSEPQDGVIGAWAYRDSGRLILTPQQFYDKFFADLKSVIEEMEIDVMAQKQDVAAENTVVGFLKRFL